MTDKPEESQGPDAASSSDALREEARLAREQAEVLITECARLMADVERSLLSREARRSAMKESRDALEKGVANLAECLRGLGAPPERAITIVKEIADNALRDVEARPRFAHDRDARELRADVVRWTINGYFGPAPARTTGPLPQ